MSDSGKSSRKIGRDRVKGANYRATHSGGTRQRLHSRRGRNSTGVPYGQPRGLGGSSARLTCMPGGWWESITRSAWVLWGKAKPGEPVRRLTGVETISELSRTGTGRGWNIQQGDMPAVPGDRTRSHQHYMN